MLRFIFRWIFRLKGWKLQVENQQGCKRCVMIAAPHTSNWDLILSVPAFELMGIPLKFTIKKEWVRFPYGKMFREIGAIPIDRSPDKQGNRKSKVEEMTELFEKFDEIAIMVTPEGTRSLNGNWKSGFYHVALNAKVPIGLGYLDYKKKLAGVGDVFMPSGNIDEDMARIMRFYKTINPKYPEKFSVDESFLNEQL